MKQLMKKLSGAAYRRIFNREMSAAEGDFVQSLSWVGAGTFVATALIAIFSILGGRLLGPEEYGKFTLIQSIAMFLYIPMLMGFNLAMLKHNSQRSALIHQKTVISTAHIIVAGFTVVSVCVMLLLARPLSGLFAATPDLFRFSVYFALLFAFFTLAQTTLRSVNRMRAFAFSQPVHGTITLIAFALFMLLGRLTYEAMLYAKLIAFGVTGLGIHLLHTRHYFSFSLDQALTRTLSRFAAATMISIVAAAFYGNIGRIIIARYMTAADVGLYGAYLTATMSVAIVLWQVFNMIFFPTASRYTDKRPLLRRINRLVPIAIVFGIPLIMGSGYLILLLYGGSYPLNPLWLALFAVVAVAFVIRDVYTSLWTSEGPRGAVVSSVAGVITAVVGLGLSVVLVPVVGIVGAATAAIVAHIIGTGVLLLTGRSYMNAP